MSGVLEPRTTEISGISDGCIQKESESSLGKHWDEVLSGPWAIFGSLLKGKLGVKEFAGPWAEYDWKLVRKANGIPDSPFFARPLKYDLSKKRIREFYGPMSSKRAKEIQSFWQDWVDGLDVSARESSFFPQSFPRKIVKVTSMIGCQFCKDTPNPASPNCEICNGNHSTGTCSYWFGVPLNGKVVGSCFEILCRVCGREMNNLLSCSGCSIKGKGFVRSKVCRHCGEYMWRPGPMPTQLTLADLKAMAAQEALDEQKAMVSRKNNAIQKPTEKVCKFWADGSCGKGDGCQNMHTWFRGDGFSMLTKFQDHHQKIVTGIVLPDGSGKLYSASKDGTVRVLDCQTGQCGCVVNLGGEAGSLISKGPWVFAGTRNAVRAWNIVTSAEYSLNAPAGQVNAMEVGSEMLFAGTQQGVILVWKHGSEGNPFQLVTSLEGHTGAVVCLKVEANRLYSGSGDCTIRVWDLNSLQCIMTLNGHSNVVTSLIFWNQFLISCSFDGTIKVWAEKGNLEVTYTHTEEHGLLGLSGMTDTEAKPILLCSSNDNSVRLFELSSFAERGRLFAKEKVGAIQVGPEGLFFSGDATGQLYVWKWTAPGPKVESASVADKQQF